MKARISAGWPHDSGHFSFYRQSPHDQARISFAEDVPRHELRDAVIGLAVFAGLVAALVTAPWWLA